MPFNKSCKASPYVLKDSKLSSHGRILFFLRDLSRDIKILDVGTATGYLGKELRKIGFKNLRGIEINAAWAQEARHFYDELIECDIENIEMPWPKGIFDVVICADLLEHLRSPELVLEKLYGLLSKDGYCLISFPNFAHWSVRMSLLFGHFEYADAGILDRSHLRFFTLNSARNLIRGSGFEIKKEIATPLPFTRLCYGKFWDSFLRLAEAIDYLMCMIFPSLFAYQFLFVVQSKITDKQ